ncbi:ATP-dependent DNA helicase [Anaerococcus sp. WCA-380-WT-2B]|uniref:ATP-dependent DNA helicase n=1 Tax=Anaerococcus porci TaxID=2652269 RepID=A0A6N7VH07_9FIRM|nr:ATP-dependent DNA helicase [Anaerococcus porci]MSS78171.1 ATP-dependent DNA helicase [Anaerococcus porci]
MYIKTSVRKLIEFVMRSGDIDNSFRDSNRMVQGIKAHQQIQKSYSDNYKAEYYLRNVTEIDDMEFHVEGRADGLFKVGDTYTIDEIKSTTRDLDKLDASNKLHWAQAFCYGYFFAVKKGLKKVRIRLTYVSLDDYRTKEFYKEKSLDELNEFYINLLKEYISFSKILSINLEKRDKTAIELTFPYKGYRRGQRKMSVAVYRAILDKRKLFVDAPTGTGKTISTIFPSVKALGEGLLDKIFYLTAKNTTAKEAIKSLFLLKEKNLSIKAVSITSKEKICLNDEIECNPNDCPFARGHFDRINNALKDILENEDIMDYDVITSYSEKHKVCPLEFELDIALYSDIIICDYNYVFDPNVYLRRFFDESLEDFIFLIDESHNLLERSRKMLSHEFLESSFKDLRESMDIKKDKTIIKSLDSILDEFEQMYKNYGKKLFYYSEKYNDDFDKKLIILSKKLEKVLIDDKKREDYDKIKDMFFEINHHIKVSDNFMEGFYMTLTFDDNSLDKIFEIKCIDPSKVLKEKYKQAVSCIFFSATLSPMEFYRKMLGAEDSLKLHLNLPFDNRNFKLLATPISTRYKDRNKNLMDIGDLIHEFISSKKGNYFIFFPSFSYLEDIYEYYKDRYDDEILVQERFMSQTDRYKFLQNFTYDSEKTAFLVLGGIFSEGVDLKGDRLIGAMVISVGMPGVSDERNLIKNHFDKINHNGFDYSYTYPGLNKIFQAAGRLIRDEKDRGIIYLIDDRFLWDKYRRLYPRHWANIKEVRDKDELRFLIDEFWNKGD